MSEENMLDFTKVLITLMTEGFIRVDGLRCKPISGDEYIIAQGVKCASNPIIRWDSNNGKLAVILPTGTVWVRANDLNVGESIEKIKKAAGGIPMIIGCHVPLSNGEDATFGDILRRLADPEWIPPYHTTEEARKAGFPG